MRIVRTVLMIATLWATSVVHATTIGRGGEVPFTFALVEFCEARHAEYKALNDAAFAGWRTRNASAVAKAVSLKEFNSNKDAARKFIELYNSVPTLKLCGDLPRDLSNPDFDVKEDDSSSERPNR